MHGRRSIVASAAAVGEMRERVHLTIDFGSLEDYMKKGGLSLTSIKCPEYSAPLRLPKVGTEVVCQHCSNTVYAQDVLEKIKELIG